MLAAAIPDERAARDPAGETRSLLVLPLFHVSGIMVSVVSTLLASRSA